MSHFIFYINMKKEMEDNILTWSIVLLFLYNDQWNLCCKVEHALLPPGPLVTQQISMVRGENNDGIIGKTAWIQGANQASNLMVNMGDRGKVRLPESQCPIVNGQNSLVFWKCSIWPVFCCHVLQSLPPSWLSKSLAHVLGLIRHVLWGLLKREIMLYFV